MPDANAAAPAVVPARKLTGQVTQLLTASGRGRLEFRSTTCQSLRLGFEGIGGSRHRGWTRAADARVPYLTRGTPMRNTRHVSIVSVEELAAIAARLEIPACDPAWLGANVVVQGVPHLSFLPRGTKMLFPSGLILSVEDQNAPCTLAGEAVMLANPGCDDIKLEFPKRASRQRGLVASVEHPGVLEPGYTFAARLPEQWLY